MTAAPQLPCLTYEQEAVLAENELGPGYTCNVILNWLCDPHVWADEDGEAPAPAGMVAIIDAEGDFVCYVLKDKAALMVRLLNGVAHLP